MIPRRSWIVIYNQNITEQRVTKIGNDLTLQRRIIIDTVVRIKGLVKYQHG